jgi:hypothetical protein
MRAAANVKRSERKTKTLAWEREFFTTTKVAPQRRVQTTRARSALREAGFALAGEEVMGGAPPVRG